MTITATTDGPVLARDDWATNGHLIADVARLGYLRPEWTTLDPTYGEGTFWSVWKPTVLIGTDINPAKSMWGRADGYGTPVDFTDMPFHDQFFGAVVFDPPYKLNGTPTDTGGIDERFGVDDAKPWRERMALMRSGVNECARVSRHMLLVKCQDQVVSAKIRWQTIAMRDELLPLGFDLRARFDFPSYRAQPSGRRQVNPAAVSSQLLVFQRGWKWSDLDG